VSAFAASRAGPSSLSIASLAAARAAREWSSAIGTNGLDWYHGVALNGELQLRQLHRGHSLERFR
jgi:hypothetical protein